MKRNRITQVGTINSLMLGEYHGSISAKELLEYGDTGIGTYNAFDGEAIIIDGHFYNGRATGVVSKMTETDTLPFSVVAKFDESVKEKTISFESFEDFKDKIVKHLGSTNYFYMIKMKGRFNVRVRSCFRQEEPYKPLYKVAKDQKELEYQNIEGYVIGVFSPNYVEGINLPGWHLHFISKDYTKGGHILKLSGKNISFKLNLEDEWNVILPHTERFSSLNLAEDLKEKTKAVEGDSKE